MKNNFEEPEPFIPPFKNPLEDQGMSDEMKKKMAYYKLVYKQNN